MRLLILCIVLTNFGCGVFLCNFGFDINLNVGGFLANKISMVGTLLKDCPSCFKSGKELWILLKLIPTTSF